MIFVTRLDKQEMFLNPDHIISIEETPDTVIALYNGHRFIVKEGAQLIIDRIVAFRSRIISRSNSAKENKLRIRNRRTLFRKLSGEPVSTYKKDRVEQERSPFHYRDN